MKTKACIFAMVVYILFANCGYAGADFTYFSSPALGYSLSFDSDALLLLEKVELQDNEDVFWFSSPDQTTQAFMVTISKRQQNGTFEDAVDHDLLEREKTGYDVSNVNAHTSFATYRAYFYQYALDDIDGSIVARYIVETDTGIFFVTQYGRDALNVMRCFQTFRISPAQNGKLMNALNQKIITRTFWDIPTFEQEKAQAVNDAKTTLHQYMDLAANNRYEEMLPLISSAWIEEKVNMELQSLSWAHFDLVHKKWIVSGIPLYFSPELIILEMITESERTDEAGTGEATFYYAIAMYNENGAWAIDPRCFSFREKTTRIVFVEESGGWWYVNPSDLKAYLSIVLEQ